MSTFVTILLGAWGGICAVWAGLLAAQLRMRRDGLIPGVGGGSHAKDAAGVLDDDGKRIMGDGAVDWPSVCVVIPARNEATTLGRCLEHVLEQDYPSLSLRVVDDRSDDGTAAVAERFAGSDGRVSVKRIETLPPGWLGKSHALWEGTRSVEADWLLFLDADCALDRRALRTVMAEARLRSVDLLSLWPRQAEGGFWEHLLIPLCAGVIALWFGSGRVNRPESGVAFANGQFLLIKRNAYERIGGHRSVRRAIIEDVPLAEHAKRSGVRCWVAMGRDLLAVRMYDGYRAIRDGWARIYVGALRSGTKIAASVLWLILGSLLPFVAAGWFLVQWTAGVSVDEPPGTAYQAAAWVCLVHLVLLCVASFRFWGLGGCRRRYLLLYPVSVLVVSGILIRAWWWLVVRRRIAWRRTSYAIDRRGEIVCL